MHKTALTVFSLLVSTQSIAHGGHDHSDPMASLVHLMWIAPLVIGAVLMVKYFNRCASTTQDKKDSNYDL